MSASGALAIHQSLTEAIAPPPAIVQLRPRPVSRIALWYELHASPRLILVAVVLAIFLPTLAMPFFIDDYRNQRLLAEYAAGSRDKLDLYAFFRSAEGNAAERAAGRAPWWVMDDLRFGYQRPLAEASLYLDYCLWKDSPVGQRLTNIILYAASVLLVLALFRAVHVGERRARWAALIFAVASSHAIPVVFIAARCDLLALVGTLGCILLGLRFVRSGNPAWALASIACYVGALLSKEVAWAGFTSFLLAALIARQGEQTKDSPSEDEHSSQVLSDRNASRRRIALQFVLLMGCGIAWLAWHRTSGGGINSTHLLDPIARPMEYLAEAPGRILVYLSSWLIPINPAVFYYHSSGRPLLIGFMVLGAIALLAAIRFFMKHSRSLRRDALFAMWPLPFVALLACALPDDRLMTLPSIGLAFLSAGLLRAPIYQPGVARQRVLRTLPLFLFIILPICTSAVTAAAIRGLETRAAQDMREMANAAEATGQDQPVVFVVNAVQAIHAIWAGDRAQHVLGPDAPRIEYLCDLPDVDATAEDSHTLRLTGRDDRFLTTLLGSFGLPRGTRMTVGQTFRANDYVVTVSQVQGDFPTVLDIRFNEPLDSPRYLFIHGTNDAPPARWQPRVGDKHAFTAFVRR